MNIKKLFTLLVIIFLICGTLFFTGCSSSSTTPPSTSKEEIAYAEAVKAGAYAYDVTEKITLDFGSITDENGNKMWRTAGSEEEHEAAVWIKDEMERIGLQNVSMEPFPVHAWTFNGASFSVLDTSGESPFVTEEIEVATLAQSPPTPPGGLTAELADVGDGTRQDYAGKDVSGKIVVTTSSWTTHSFLNATVYETRLHGAIGVICDFEGYHARDTLFSYPLEPYEGSISYASTVITNKWS